MKLQMLASLLKNVNEKELMASFKLMGQSMLAIFIAMGAIALIVYLFTKFSK